MGGKAVLDRDRKAALAHFERISVRARALHLRRRTASATNLSRVLTVTQPRLRSR